MKRIIVVSFISILAFGTIHTLLYEDTWAAVKYKFGLGLLNGFIPFLIGTTIYHFIFQALVNRVSYLNTLLAQICLGILISTMLMILFIVADYGADNRLIVEKIRNEATFIIGAGLTISLVYYSSFRFHSKK